MRHLVSGRKLNRTASHRKAMFSNLSMSLLDKERVSTTLVKAKEVRGVVERLISYGKKGGIHAIRLAARRINDKTLLKKLFDDIAPAYKDRDGGYTRIIKTTDRKGDKAPMAIIELVGRGTGEAVRKRKKKKGAKTQQTPGPVQEAKTVQEEVKPEEVSKESPVEATINEEKAEPESK